MKNSRKKALYCGLCTAVAALIVLICTACGNDNNKKEETPTEEPTTVEVDYHHSPDVISLEKSMLIMGIGETYKLTALYDYSKPAGGATYASSKPKVATVDADTGELTAVGEGYTTITVTSFNGIPAKCYVTVKKAPTGLSFVNNNVHMLPGEKTSFVLKPAKTDEGVAEAFYTSSDSDIVSVTKNGAVTAVAEGTATVTATAYNGKQATTTVHVVRESNMTSKTTTHPTYIQMDADWSSPTLGVLPEHSMVRAYGENADGRWIKVESNDIHGWVYNKAFGAPANYKVFTNETLPVMADDLIFDVGRDKRKIFDYVINVPYDTTNDYNDTVENLCVQYFMYYRGSCYHHAALLSYLYNRCGWETVTVTGVSNFSGMSDHSWCLSKTRDGWKNVDAQYFTGRNPDEQYFISDYSQHCDWDKSFGPDIDL